jgi:hypothetical protein
MPKQTRKPVIATLKPEVLVEAEAEKVRGGYFNPKELTVDKVATRR